MKPTFRSLVLASAAVLASPAQSITVTVDETAAWLGYMNVFELPENGSTFMFGSAWGVADLQASFEGPVLTLAPNVIGDPAVYWYIGGGGPGQPGNKIMNANMYVEPPAGTLSGQNVVFTGTVTSNTLTDAHAAVAFIKDFAPDYSSFNVVTAPLVNGTFSISMDTVDDPARHVQYGFETTGVNVWVTDVEPFGSVRIQAAEPSPNVTVDPGAPWQGHMNVFNLPEPDGDGTLFLSSEWAPADLTATFSGGVLTLGPNSINPPDGYLNEDYYRENEEGNKIMEATMYVELPPGSFPGETINFSGTVVSNTFTEAHTVTAFIKDYAADYSSFEITSVPLVDGTFQLSMPSPSDPERHIRYGFETVGVNVWVDHLAGFGNMQLTAASAPDPFAPWIAGFDFSAFTDPDLTKTGDPDGDGLSNLEEFALDGNPASAAASGKTRFSVEDVSGEQAVILTLPVRGVPEFAGDTSKSATVEQMTYLIEGSNDLGTFDQMISEVVPARDADLPATSAGWSYRSFRLDGAIGGVTSRGPRGFIRAEITSAP